MFRNISIIIFFIFFLTKTSYSKGRIKYSAKNKSTIAEYEKAKHYLYQKKYNKAKVILAKIIRGNSSFLEAKILLAKLSQKLGDFSECKKILDKTVKKLPSNKLFNLHLEISYIYYRSGQYKKAYSIIKNIPTRLFPKNIRYKAKDLKKNLKFSIKTIQKPSHYDPKPMPYPLNIFAAQYFPILSLDQQQVLFTGRKGYKISSQENIYISKKDKNGKWSIPISISENINTQSNEGACTLSSDGNILIFSAYNRKTNYGSCDLYISFKKNSLWTEPKNLGPKINSEGWQSQPSLSSDGKTLFFASKRKGNYGKKDIWKSTLKENGQWSKAVNLGNTINSKGTEISPFIHPNGKTLFFASDRNPSLGGLDIYYSELVDGKWTNPKNLGYPINDYKDQVSLYVTADGKKGYYAAGTQKGIYYNGKLYEFEIPRKLKPNPVCIFVKGMIKPIPMSEIKFDTNIFIFDIEKNKIEKTIKVSQNRNYCISLNQGKNYAIYFSQKGCFLKKVIVNLKEVKPLKNIIRDVQFSSFKKGQKKTFNNIIFDFDKYIIKKEAQTELMEFVIFLKENENITTVIEGYTDEVGTKAYNIKLSTKRAKEVYRFLIKNGIKKKQLKYIGLGKSVDENISKLKRKVAFRIEKIKPD